jgi:hypothetical protein
LTQGRRDTKVRKGGIEDTGKKRHKFKKLKIQKQSASTGKYRNKTQERRNT